MNVHPALAALLFTTSLFAAENWPQFRGPAGDGRSDAAGLPVRFSETENVKWKTAIHGKAWSSPVVWGAQVWLTTANEEGTELSVVCVDKNSGKVLRDDVVFRVATPQFCHKFNSYASPTPVIEAGRIYVTFGSPGTACLDTASGAKLWERTDFVCNHYRGAGSSPIVWGDLLIINFDGSDAQFVVALDKKTGKTVWQTARSVDYQDLGKDGKPEGEGDYRKAFSTPQVIEQDGKTVLISSGAKAHYGYDPKTGRELWRYEDRSNHSAATRPVAGFGMVFIAAGFGKGQVLALKLGGSGVLAPEALAWSLKKAAPNKPSLLLIGDLIYAINDGGIASCVEAKTGAVVWSERIGGNFSAAPIAADGRIYACNEEGKVTVIAPGREFKVLAESQFDAGFMAAPAVSGKALFLRTKTHLYRVEE
ncbi:MAG: PQQ-binding-like beta-propeller repeat protein [Chthoniobacteraceae bacterium]